MVLILVLLFYFDTLVTAPDKSNWLSYKTTHGYCQVEIQVVVCCKIIEPVKEDTPNEKCNYVAVFSLSALCASIIQRQKFIGSLFQNGAMLLLRHLAGNF